MEYKGQELDDFETDFAAPGFEVEFDEDDAEGCAVEMQQLVERVKAARSCGA